MGTTHLTPGRRQSLRRNHAVAMSARAQHVDWAAHPALQIHVSWWELDLEWGFVHLLCSCSVEQESFIIQRTEL